ncbi:hypothetical protein MACJ_003348 [Theileria orientalis]|uniref:Uncharacterized protein n=1 Tax=Theileria orientalis TaxID=68886 RepID=A0A976XJ45_THEOR|nr:hypothetical protein MACJ_003348 [Theileria orientalis]
MKFGANRDYIQVSSVFDSLNVNRKLFCNYLKEYANKKNQCLYDSVLSYLEELLMESIVDLRKIESVAKARSNRHSLDHPIDIMDKYLSWKNDLVLRIIVMKNLVLFYSRLYLLIETTGHS